MKTADRTIKSLSTRKVAKEHYKASFSKNTLQTKIKTQYKEGSKNSYSLTIKLRMKKDEVIWMSGSFLGFPIAKVKITPTRVQFYEKIKKTYFDGDFSLISKTLGTELNFQQLQNLLTGQSLLDIDNKHTGIVESRSYRLSPKDQDNLFDIFYWINPKHFKIDKQQINNKQANQSLVIKYLDYQKIKDEFLPKIITINATEKKRSTSVKMDFRSIEFDKNLRFPFAIPPNYKKIDLKNI